MKFLNTGLTPAPFARVAFPIGAGFDIPTGNFITGQAGDLICNGGLSPFTGVAALANTFKSTVMRFKLSTVYSHILIAIRDHNLKAKKPFLITPNVQEYDTETQTQLEGIRRLIYRNPILAEAGVLESGQWTVTSRGEYYADKYYEIIKAFRKEKIKDRNNLLVPTAFVNQHNGQSLQIILPTFENVDSLSHFETENAQILRDKNAIGSSATNTQHARQSLDKTAYLLEQPGFIAQAGVYLTMVAHIGYKIGIGDNPMAAPLPKKLDGIPTGLQLKYVPEQFTFLPHNCFYIQPATTMSDPNTKEVLYPRDADDTNFKDPDLRRIVMHQLRGKNGPTGVTVPLLVSQQEGVLPHLSQFHAFKDHPMERHYGMDGNDRNYVLTLCPDVKLSRTTVRGKIDSNLALQRAIEITSDLRQLRDYKFYQYRHLLCTPKELFDDIKAQGFDWDEILATRGWHSIFDYDIEQKRLSIVDLLNMRKGVYKPYWMQ